MYMRFRIYRKLHKQPNHVQHFYALQRYRICEYNMVLHGLLKGQLHQIYIASHWSQRWNRDDIL